MFDVDNNVICIGVNLISEPDYGDWTLVSLVLKEQLYDLLVWRTLIFSLTLLFFHSFEAGIAKTISSLKWIKNNIIYEKYTSP